MKNNYLRQYAKHFNYYTDGISCWDNQGAKTVELINDRIHYKTGSNKWSWGKQGDLLVCIINGIPLR